MNIRFAELAIRVSAVGETRSKERRLLMDGGVTSAMTDLEKGRGEITLEKWEN